MTAGASSKFQSSRGSVLDRQDRPAEGLILVNRRSKIILYDLAAREFSNEGSLRFCGGILYAHDETETTLLRQAVADCVSGPNGTTRYALASRGADRPPFSLLVTRVADEISAPISTEGLAAIFVIAPERQPMPRPEQLRQQFGLTAAEAAVALQIISGDGVPAVAGRLGITQGTVKIHLAHVFAKTGTSRQAQLVRLVLTIRHRERQGSLTHG